MPTTYTHYSFGREVLPLLPEAMQQRIAANRSIWSFGLHGPDIFFYRNPFVKNPVSRIGWEMHTQSGEKVLRRFARLDDGSDRSFAYLAGFLCHFALDSTCHAYIDAQKAHGVSHSLLETELDRHFLLKDGLDPVTHDPASHLHPSGEAARAIARFYPQATECEVEQALKEMVLYLRLLTAKTAPKRKLLDGAFRVLKAQDSFGGMVMPRKPVPACQPMVRHLLELYRQSIPLAVELITAWPDLRNPQYQLNFNGVPGKKREHEPE